MTELSRVRPPRSPLDGRWAGAAAIGAALLIVAITKPWADDPTLTRSGPTPWPGRTDDADAARIVVPPRTLPYDPLLFGVDPPAPAWEIWATEPLVGVPFTGPPDAPAPTTDPAAGSSTGPGRAGSGAAPTPLIGGPVIDLGSTDTLSAFAVNTPAGSRIASVRLWQFVDGGAPRRIELTELPTAAGAATFRAWGLRMAALPDGEVLAWQPGLYRLDLLVDPAERIRSLMLTVRPGTVPPGGATAGEAGPGAPLDPALLARLPAEATLWTFGPLLTGWARPSADGTCRVAEMWRGTDELRGCRPLPIGSPRALGVNLPPSTVLEEIRLVAVDPLPGAIDITAPAPVPGMPGVASVEPPAEGLPDGIYRLDVTARGGRTLHWYLEVSPAGRRAAELSAAR